MSRPLYTAAGFRPENRQLRSQLSDVVFSGAVPFVPETFVARASATENRPRWRISCFVSARGESCRKLVIIIMVYVRNEYLVEFM